MITKKITATLLALIMTLALLGTASADKNAEEGNTAATDLLMGLGVLSGYPDGTLGLENDVTRAETAKLLTVLVLGAKADELETTDAPFSDTPPEHWAAPYISYCAQQGIIAGMGDGSFRPDDKVTQAQLMAMTLRILNCGAFTGETWKSDAEEAARKLGVFGEISISDTNAKRETVINTIYQSLFAVIAGTENDTLAKRLKVEVIKLANGKAGFLIDGADLGGSYEIEDGKEFPPADAPVWQQELIGEECVLLSVNKENGSIRLLKSDAKAISISITGVEAERYAGGVGGVVLWDESGRTLAMPENITGTVNLTKNTEKLGDIPVDKDTIFLVRTIDGSYEAFDKYTGVENVPTILDAEYSAYAASDGKLYIYISNGQNSPSYVSDGQIFLIDPTNYYIGIDSGVGSKYYATLGAINGEVGIVKFTESCGREFFIDRPEIHPGMLKPGLYMHGYGNVNGTISSKKGVLSFEGMRVSNVPRTYSTVKTVQKVFYGSGNIAYDDKSQPVRGIAFEDGKFYIGTNKVFSGVLSTIRLTPKDLNLKAFYFDISKDGEVTMSIRRLSEVENNDRAYVWGTIAESIAAEISEIKGDYTLLNLYIVNDASGKWGTFFQ